MNALYESKPTVKSLGGRYIIYQDRIELKHPIFPNLIIKKEELISIKEFSYFVTRSIKGSLSLKLDLADLNEHVGIERKNGLFKNLRFTPENPKEFVSKVKEIFNI